MGLFIGRIRIQNTMFQIHNTASEITEIKGIAEKK
jgi:hypothetical protein